MSEPRVGIHAWRLPLVDLAGFDVLGTLLVALLLTRGRGWAAAFLVFGLLLLLGEILHLAFGVSTPVADFIRQRAQ